MLFPFMSAFYVTESYRLYDEESRLLHEGEELLQQKMELLQRRQEHLDSSFRHYEKTVEVPSECPCEKWAQQMVDTISEITTAGPASDKKNVLFTVNYPPQIDKRCPELYKQLQEHIKRAGVELLFQRRPGVIRGFTAHKEGLANFFAINMGSDHEMEKIVR